MSIAGLIVLYFLVKINEAQRVITINYAKRVHGNSNYGDVKSILPVKLIAAGVIPVIFAVAFLSLPQFVGQVMKASGNADLLPTANKLITWFQAPNAGSFTGSTAEAFIYPTLYFILVIAFTYFYTGIVFNANEIAENLQKQGGFIEGVRPGAQTEKYLMRTVNRLIFVRLNCPRNRGYFAIRCGISHVQFDRLARFAFINRRYRNLNYRISCP